MAASSVRLRWEGEGERFRGGASGGPEVTVDGAGRAGPSPMQQLLLALAGCMGADIVDIMAKSRAPLGGLEILVEGERAPQPPRCYTSITMTFTARGWSGRSSCHARPIAVCSTRFDPTWNWRSGWNAADQPTEGRA